MIRGCKGCALPAGGHIIRPKVISERDTKRSLHSGAVDELKGRPGLISLGCAMQHGLTVDTRKTGRRPRPSREQLLPCLKMGAGNNRTRRIENTVRLRANPIPRACSIGGALQCGALFRCVFTLRSRSEFQNLFTIS